MTAFLHYLAEHRVGLLLAFGYITACLAWFCIAGANGDDDDDDFDFHNYA